MDKEEVQVDAKACEVARLLDGLTLAMVMRVLMRTQTLINSTVRVNISSPAFIEAEKGYQTRSAAGMSFAEAESKRLI